MIQSLCRQFLCGLLLSIGVNQALALDPMPFKDTAEEQRFQAITRELRCLVCQNQNIADSNAELAKDLRNEVFEMMRAGQSDDQIKQFMTERYGDFVLYRPPMKGTTWLLWLAPIGVLLGGAILVLRLLRRRRDDQNTASTDTAPTNESAMQGAPSPHAQALDASARAATDPNEMIP